MTPSRIHLQYRIGDAPQGGAEIQNELFDLIGALQAAGSIRHAAGVLGCSYRHL